MVVCRYFIQSSLELVIAHTLLYHIFISSCSWSYIYVVQTSHLAFFCTNNRKLHGFALIFDHLGSLLFLTWPIENMIIFNDNSTSLFFCPIDFKLAIVLLILGKLKFSLKHRSYCVNRIGKTISSQRNITNSWEALNQPRFR